MRYYKRFRPTGDPFYIDERGNEVSENTAKGNLVKEGGVRFAESHSPRLIPAKPATTSSDISKSLVEGYKALGLTESEARIAAGQEPKQVGDPFLQPLFA